MDGYGNSRLTSRTRRMSKHTVFSDDISAIKTSVEESLTHALHPGKNIQEMGAMDNKDNFRICRNDSQETKNLKELMLSHLDLIQQQQEVLIKKDREIQSLKSEADTLRCRLDRMERRMSLMKHQKETEKPPRPTETPEKSITHTPREERKERTRRSHSRANSPALPERSTPREPRGTKRKGCAEPQNLSKRLASSHSESPRASILAQYEMSPKQLPYARFGEYKRPVVNDSPGPRDHTSWPSWIRRPGALDGVPDSMQETKDRIKQVVFENKHRRICRTRNPYVVIGEGEENDEEVKFSRQPEPVQEQVFVPSWRVMKIPTAYSMEGTEPLDDEIFNKRHLKLETDEKRRKRWDLQRMREQSMYERLHQQQGRVGCAAGGASNGRSHDDHGSSTVSFLADPDEAKYIEISDDVPVSAFGLPIPTYSSCEFELPWGFSLDKRDHQERSRSKRKKR